MNMKLDGENGKSVVMVKWKNRKVWWFSINEFCKNIGCLVSKPTLGNGVLRLWDKY